MAAKNVAQDSVKLRQPSNRNHKSEALRSQWGGKRPDWSCPFFVTSGLRGFKFAMATLAEEREMSQGQPGLCCPGRYCLKLG